MDDWSSANVIRRSGWILAGNAKQGPGKSKLITVGRVFDRDRLSIFWR